MTEDQLLAQAKLQLHIANPDYEECYLHGYDDFQSNNDVSSNPYESNSCEAQYYNDGWWDAFQAFAPAHSLTDEAAIETAEIAHRHSLNTRKKISAWKKLRNKAYQVISVVIFIGLGYSLIDMALTI